MRPKSVVDRARELGLVVLAFNVPYLPMVEPVIQSVVDMDSFAFVATARLEWLKFQSQGPEAVAREYARYHRSDHVRLHLDHVPVIDEDGQNVDVLPIIARALAVGYHSVMVDGSRLSLGENIAISNQVADLAHRAGVPCEAELGAVLGHEAEQLPPYEELFASGRGFTDVSEAAQFARETGCDWLSVAIGNVHGAISGALRNQPKIEARLNLERLRSLSEATRIPLVLHGGSGISREHVLAAIKTGIAKVNIGTDIRQPYEAVMRQTGRVTAAQQAVYERAREIIADYRLAGIRARITACVHASETEETA